MHPNFPHPTYRKYQEETINKILELFKTNEYVILESPTGSGKSANAVTIGASYSSYLLTSQKLLQDQYARDYDVALLKGRSNYDCLRHDCTCAEGCKIKSCRSKLCPYTVAKENMLSSQIGLMNYTYFMLATEHTDSIPYRELLICDEAHNIELEIMKNIEFEFNAYRLKKLGLSESIPKYSNINSYVEYIKNILEQCNKLMTRLSSFATYDKDALLNNAKEMDEVSALTSKITRFLSSYNQCEWVSDSLVTDRGYGVLSFKPVSISYFAKDILFNKCGKKLLMSATIDHDVTCRSLGIEAEYIQVPSTFPPENRPMYFTNTGSMTYKDLDSTLPDVVKVINQMLNHHKDKGIIHCGTYKVSKYIMEHCANSRLMTHDSHNRDEVLKRFIESKDGVLVSPSMTEGLDLKDDLARFVVIVKIPYLCLGDKQIKRRCEVDPQWYQWRAAITLMQSAGRAMRHEEDNCIIYVMDSAIETFIQRNRKMFPEYFIDAIQDT